MGGLNYRASSTTANFMTKLSLGKAEDLATTVILASNKDILLAPQ